MSLEKRLQRLEYRQMHDLVATLCEGVPGVSAEAVLNYARKVYALPEAEQRELFRDFYATLTEAELAELDVIRRRHVAILGRVHGDARWRNR